MHIALRRNIRRGPLKQQWRSLCSKVEDSAKKKKLTKEEIFESYKQQVKKSFFGQMNQVAQMTELKLFPANETLMTPEDASTLPRLSVESLQGSHIDIPRKGTCTLLLVGFNQMGYDMLESWRLPVERHLYDSISSHKKHGRMKLQIVELSVNESKLFTYLKGFISRAFKKTIDAKRLSNTAAFFGDFQSWKGPLGIDNTLIGYSFLVDSNGRVRWRGSGICSFDESMILIELINKLQNETDKK